MKHSRHGGSLIELLVALGLFATAYLSLMGLLVSGRTATVQGRDLTIATGLARELMETSRIVPYGNLNSLAEDRVDVPITVQGKSSAVTFWRRLDVVSVLAGKAKSLSVKVHWTVGALDHQVALVTYVGQ